MIRRRALLSLIEYKQNKPSIHNNKIWYTSTDVVVPNNIDAFGTTIISNEWDSETGKGIITFDGDITTIGDYAFYSCDSLTSITIGDSVTTIGSYAFSNCDSLTSVTIPDSVITIGDRSFIYCSSLTSVTIGNSVTTIGDYAFQHCDSLTSVTIPDSVTEIGYYAFLNCNSLTSITIPDSVTTIGGGAFNGCSNLTSVTIGDSVTEIGDYTFYNCSSLTSVYCKATTPPALGGTYVFDNNGSGRKIYVPMESVNKYKSASGWSEYADAIEGYDFGDDGEESGNLITFTFDDTEYQAEEGMTWEEFCNSEYNINSFCVVEVDGSNQIWCYGGSHVSASNYVYDAVSKDDLIINNHAYYGVSGEPI